MNYDNDTGEIAPNGNGSIAGRASRYASEAHVQMQRDKLSIGNNMIADAIERAMHEIPLWVKAEKEGARGKYAPLKDILAAVRPPLLKFGVRIRQGAESSRGADEGAGVKARLIPVYTDLVHTATGAMERTTVEIPLAKLDAMAMGSALTYGRRYSLLAALGITTDEADDDGRGAMPHDLRGEIADSDALTELKAEIDAAKDIDKLTAWSIDQKARKRINQLSEAEAERLRQHYARKRQDLSAE